MTTSSVPTETSAMPEHHLQPIITGALESLSQVHALLSDTSQDQYVHVCVPHVQSSMGSHVRHILDMFYAFELGVTQNEVIDYDLRRRGAAIETSLSDALTNINQTIDWIKNTFVPTHAQIDTDTALLASVLSAPAKVKTEVCLSHTVSVHVESNVGRELIFVASHAVHHFALLATIAKLQGLSLDDHFGVAPATRTFLRQEQAR